MFYSLGLLLLSVVGDSIDHDLQYITALRTDAFYRLAHLQGQQLLSDSELTTEQRSQIVVEISKTFAAQALNSRPPRRETFWGQAVEVLEQELRSQSDPALKVLLQSQLAFIKEQQAEWSVRESEIRSQSDADWATARGLLRDAIKSLKQVEQDLDTPDMRRQKALSDVRLNEIKRHVQYQLANAYFHQAIAYNTSSQDRTNALTQAMNFLQPLATGREMDELVWQSRIDRVRCVRMLGQYKQAQQLIKQLSSAPEKYIGALAAESIRLALDANNLEAAMQLAMNQQIDANDPEFQLARIEALVTAAEQLKGLPKANAFQQQASTIAANMAQRHGVYWSLRGEILLSRLARDKNANASLLSNAAETMLRQDSPDEAKQMFVRAAQQAGQNDEAKAFEFLYKAAIVDHREGKLQPAIDQFRDAAAKYPQHPQAAEAHLLAAFDAAALYQEYAAAKSSTLDRALQQYETLLTEHIHVWPDNPTADQARMWSAKLAMAKRQWLTAIELYQGVPIGSKWELDAYQGLGAAYAKWIASQKSTEQQVQLQRAWMQSRFESLTAGGARERLATEAANLFMLYQPQDYASADAMLLAAKGDLSDSDSHAQFAASLVIASAGNRHAEQARFRLAEFAPLPLESLLFIVKGLQPIRDRQPNDADLRTLTIEVVGMLKSYDTQINADDRLTIALAVADYSTTSEALSRYEQFAKENPTHLRIQRRYAELLSMIQNRESRELALRQWRRVAQMTDKQSTDWFAAKLGVAQSHFELGERKKAKALIEYLQVLYPELGGEEQKGKFEQLLQVCGP